MRRLEGRTAIVTGAKIVAGGGGNIGSATAATLAREGAAVVVTDIDGAGAERVAESIRDEGGRAAAIEADISLPDDWKQVVATATDLSGRLDVLVNNAAYYDFAGDTDPITIELDVWTKTIVINTSGTMLGCKHALPAMLAGGGGSIINLVSVQALTGHVTRPAYAAAKGALVTYTKYVAAAYGKQGIRCNAIAPGLTLSAVVDSVVPQEIRDIHLRHALADRLSAPQDTANAILFLASDESAMINGQVIPVDAGVTAVRPEAADYRSLAEERGIGPTSATGD